MHTRWAQSGGTLCPGVRSGTQHWCPPRAGTSTSRPLPPRAPFYLGFSATPTLTFIRCAQAQVPGRGKGLVGGLPPGQAKKCEHAQERADEEGDKEGKRQEKAAKKDGGK